MVKRTLSSPSLTRIAYYCEASSASVQLGAQSPRNTSLNSQIFSTINLVPEHEMDQ